MHHRSIFAAVALAAATIIPVAAEEAVPAPVLAAAQLGEDAIIVEVEREVDDGRVIYEVEVRVGTADHELEIAADGTVLEHQQEVAVAELPEAVVVAATIADDAVIVAAERETAGDRDEYQVEVRVGTAEHELTIAADGTVLEHEEELAVAEVPEAIRARVLAAAPGVKLVEAERETEGDEVEWTFEGRDAEGRRIEIEIDAEGKVEVEQRRGRGRGRGRDRGDREARQGDATSAPEEANTF